MPTNLTSFQWGFSPPAGPELGLPLSTWTRNSPSFMTQFCQIHQRLLLLPAPTWLSFSPSQWRHLSQRGWNMPLAHTDDQWSTRNNRHKTSQERKLWFQSVLPQWSESILGYSPPNPPAPSSGAACSCECLWVITHQTCLHRVTHDTLHNCTLWSCLLVFSISSFLLSLVSALGSLPTQKIAPPRISKNAFPINSLVLSSLFCLSRWDCLEASQNVFFSSLFCLSRWEGLFPGDLSDKFTKPLGRI